MELATALRMAADELARCEICGQEHKLRPRKAGQYMSWADPDDGHAYRRQGLSGHDPISYLRERADELENA